MQDWAEENAGLTEPQLTWRGDLEYHQPQCPVSGGSAWALLPHFAQ